VQYRHEKHEAITIRWGLEKARHELSGKGSGCAFFNEDILVYGLWYVRGRKAREEDQFDSSPMVTLIKNPNAITIWWYYG
jgi:hypothetical protein